MDHRQNIQNFLVGREFTIPLQEVNNFYASLLVHLDGLGDQLIHRVPDPMLLAISLIEAGRQCVIDKSRDQLAERLLRTAIKIIRQIAPDANELKAQNLRYLGIILCRLGKHGDAQRCNIEASYCAERAGLTL